MFALDVFMQKKKFEPWIRVHGETGSTMYLELACGYGWDKRGCYESTEAYCILVSDREKRLGRIVESGYNFGPYEFTELTPLEDSGLVVIPESLINSARRDYCCVSEKVLSEISDIEKKFCTHSAVDFKPMNLEDLEFVRKNCG